MGDRIVLRSWWQIPWFTSLVASWGSKETRETPLSWSKQMSCPMFPLQMGQAQHHALEESKRKGKNKWEFSLLFSSFYKKITEMDLNQTPQPPWRCLQLIWSVDAVSFCVTHFFSLCGNGCAFSCTPGITTLSYPRKLDVTNTWVTLADCHLSIRSEVFFRESCR